MSESKQSADELSEATDNAAEETLEQTEAPKGKLAQALMDKKAAVAKNNSQPPFPSGKSHRKGQKIGAAPRGTRRSMGKR